MNPLDWSLWLLIPFCIFVYLCIAMADAVLWNYLAEATPATQVIALDGGRNGRVVRSSAEEEDYKFKKNVLVPWAWGWPIKYTVFPIIGSALWLVGVVDDLLKNSAEMGQKTRDAKLLPRRLERYDEIYDKLTAKGDLVESNLSSEQNALLREYRALEAFVPAKALPFKQPEPRRNYSRAYEERY